MNSGTVDIPAPRSRAQQVLVLFFLLSLSSLILLAALLYGFYRYESGVESKVLSKDLKNSSDLYQKVAGADLRDVATDLILFSRDYRLPAFLDNPFGPLRQGLTQDFLDLAIAKGRYDQIRIIATDGHELLRVNYNNGHPLAVERSRLQHKAKRYYVTDTLRLEPGQIYVSPLDLNIEYGQIERPLKPMLRLGTPLRDALGRKSAILIMNYLAEELFARLKQASKGRVGDLYMLNSQGYGLMGPSSDELWGFMLPQNKTNSFNQLYAAAWRRIQRDREGYFQTPRGIFAFRTVSMPLGPYLGLDKIGQAAAKTKPRAPQPQWKLVEFVSTAELQTASARRKEMALLLLLTVGLVLVGASWWVARMVVARRMDQRALRQAKVAAEAANEAKSQFLATMSHEIRTPMNAIIGLGSLALRTDLSPKQRDYLTKINSSARGLLGIINDILDFSKIEAGKLEVENLDFNLEEALKNVINLLAGRAQEKGLELLFNPGPKLPKGLVGDPLRLGQVLINLGNNAIKFTEHGEVEIKITEQERFNDRVTLRFTVRDTGIGISKQEQQKLFQAFSQADVSTTRRFGGTGLGLAISKRLVDLMNGEIWLESTPGQGSTFGFTATFGLSDAKPLHAPMKYEQLHAVRVLVVDDNAQARGIFSTMLASMSFRVEAVDSGPAAIAALEKVDRDDPYRLVLMDWEMPVMDGYEAIGRIRRSSKISKQPKIIMVTAPGREKVPAESDKTKPDGLLLKPVTPSLLFNALVEVLCQSVECADELEKPRPEESPGGEISLAGNQVLLVEDNEINQQVAQEILEQAGLQVDIVVNGQEAVEAVNAGGYDAVLMDVQMPVMDGYEATRRIRREHRFRDLPIIAMTAGAMAGDREKALAAGMNDFVAKPIDIKRLLTVLAGYMRPAAPAAVPSVASEAPSAPDQEPLPQAPGLDLQAGLGRLGGNRVLYRKLLDDFARDYAHILDQVGQELAAGRVKTAEGLVHALKGVAGNIGATEVFQRAQALDAELKQGRADDASQLLQALSQALRPLLEALVEMKPQAPPGPAGGQKPYDAQALHTALEQLDDLLAQSDPEARETLERLGSYLSGPETAALIEQIARHLSKYDFEAARQDLGQLSEVVKGK